MEYLGPPPNIYAEITAERLRVVEVYGYEPTDDVALLGSELGLHYWVAVVTKTASLGIPHNDRSNSIYQFRAQMVKAAAVAVAAIEAVDGMAP